MLPAHAENIPVLLDIADFLRINAVDEAHIQYFNFLCLNRMFNIDACKAGNADGG
jgi:hypothetical protein